MNSANIRGILIFVVILIALNFVFGLHISIVGSLLLTVILNVALNAFMRR